MSTDTTTPAFENLRDIDRAVLEFVKGGVNSLRAINAQTHDEVDGRQIGHAFTKLERMGLITVETPEGYTESVIDGQRRVHRKSRRATLTEKSLQYFEWADDREQRRKYEEMSWGELTAQVAEIEELARTNQEQIEQNQFRTEQIRKTVVDLEDRFDGLTDKVERMWSWFKRKMGGSNV